MATIESYETAKGTRYMVRYRTPDHRITTKRGFKRKKDARDWTSRTEISKNDGSFIPYAAGSVTVGELGETWLQRKKISVKPSWYRRIDGAWDRYVKPKWSHVAVRDVAHKDVQQWVTAMAEKMSASSTDHMYGVLAGILDDAVSGGMIARNQARGVTLPKKPRRRHTYLTPEQLRDLASACVNHQRRSPMDPVHETMILLLGTVGLRWGELAGLRIRDVDLNRHRLNISVSATQVGTEIFEGTPKSGMARSVVFPEFLDDRLRALIGDRDGAELVFRARDGGYVRQVSPGKRSGWFGAACDRAGVPRMTVHDLRHTAASLMVRSGANVKAVQRQLGHASAAMTLDVYADLFDDDLDAVGDAVSVLFDKM